jgi:hypothetical protein
VLLLAVLASVAGSTTGKKIGFDFWTFHVCHFLPSLRAPLNFSYLQQKCSLPLQVFHHVQKRKASSCCQETKNNLIFPGC